MTDSLQVVAFTDGAAKGNPGPGGWGAVMLIAGASVRELGASGGHTTNNRMEMMAVTCALEWLAASETTQPMEVLVVTDSTYVLRGVTEWVANWKRRGWKTLQGEDVAKALRGLVGEVRGVVFRTPENPIEAVDERIQLVRREMFHAPKVRDHTMTDPSGIITIALDELKVTASTRLRDLRVHAATITPLHPAPQCAIG